jgi:hypothetical protein
MTVVVDRVRTLRGVDCAVRSFGMLAVVTLCFFTAPSGR